jgi:hypothetical protein
MAISDSDIPSTPPPLRLERCPDCAYLLTGLPEQGLCPECGFAYGPDLIVLYGWPDTSAGPPRIWLSLVFPVAMTWCGTYLALSLLPLQSPGLSQFVPYVQLLLILIVAGLQIRQAIRRSRRGPPVQVRFTPAGLGQRTGFGPLKLTPWDHNIRIDFRMLARGYCHIHAHFVGFVPDKVSSKIVSVSVENGAVAKEHVRRCVGLWR